MRKWLVYCSLALVVLCFVPPVSAFDQSTIEAPVVFDEFVVDSQPYRWPFNTALVGVQQDSFELNDIIRGDKNENSGEMIGGLLIDRESSYENPIHIYLEKGRQQYIDLRELKTFIIAGVRGTFVKSFNLQFDLVDMYGLENDIFESTTCEISFINPPNETASAFYIGELIIKEMESTGIHGLYNYDVALIENLNIEIEFYSADSISFFDVYWTDIVPENDLMNRWYAERVSSNTSIGGGSFGDNTGGNTSYFYWLQNVVESVMGFQIAPGVKLNTLLYFGLAIGLLFVFLKFAK